MGIFSRKPPARAVPAAPPEPDPLFEDPDLNWVRPDDLTSITPDGLVDMTNAEISAFKLALDQEIERFKAMEAEQKGKPSTLATMDFTTRILRARSARYEQISAVNFERLMRGQIEVSGIEPRRVGHNGRVR